MEDFPALAEALLAFYGRQYGKSPARYKRAAMEYLRSYTWPGNIRELRNVIERAVILARQPEIGIQDLPPNLCAKDSAAVIGDLVPLDTVEELHIRGVLATTASLESAAKILGIDYATLWRRRKKYGL
jgi:NtrC-family two-component system response regulator AlgB